MKRVIRNVAASVRERLLNRARTEGEEFNLVLRRYSFERFFYRLGASSVSERFILKGAMLLQLWAEQPYRATIDLDLLRKGDTDRESLTRDLREVMKTTVPDNDGVFFDPDSISVDDIRIEDEYSGVRVHFVARLGTARHLLQVDIGFGDSAWPPPKRTEYPSLLGSRAPKILTYARETVIAEKLEAMVLLRIRNSRIKDFFDVHYLASNFPFDGTVLAEAIRRTFRRRRMVIPIQIPVRLHCCAIFSGRRSSPLPAAPTSPKRGDRVGRGRFVGDHPRHGASSLRERGEGHSQPATPCRRSSHFERDCGALTAALLASEMRQFPHAR